MKDKLNKLDELIKTKRGAFYTALNEPLPEIAVAQLEAEYNVQLSADVRALYAWKNGQRDDVSDSFVNNSMFLPLEEALSAAQELTGMIGADFEEENWWNEGWLPLFHNGGGDYICYDRNGTFTGEPGQLIEFWHADADRNVIAPDLESFIRQMLAYYEHTDPADFDGYFETEDIAGFPKSFLAE